MTWRQYHAIHKPPFKAEPRTAMDDNLNHYFHGRADELTRAKMAERNRILSQRGYRQSLTQNHNHES